MLNRQNLDQQVIDCVLSRIKHIANNKLYYQLYPNDTNEYNLPYCCHLQVFINGKEYNSWGNGFSKDEASFKCVAELIERLIYSHSYPIKFLPFKGFFKKKKYIFQLKKEYPLASRGII